MSSVAFRILYLSENRCTAKELSSLPDRYCVCFSVAVRHSLGCRTRYFVLFQLIVRDFFLSPKSMNEKKKRSSGSARECLMGSCDVVWICLVVLKAIP